ESLCPGGPDPVARRFLSQGYRLSRHCPRTGSVSNLPRPLPARERAGFPTLHFPCPYLASYSISSFTAPRITRQSGVRWCPSQYSRRLPSNGGRACLPAPACLLSGGFPASPRTGCDLPPESAPPLTSALPADDGSPCWSCRGCNPP